MAGASIPLKKEKFPPPYSYYGKKLLVVNICMNLNLSSMMQNGPKAYSTPPRQHAELDQLYAVFLLREGEDIGR